MVFHSYVSYLPLIRLTLPFISYHRSSLITECKAGVTFSKIVNVYFGCLIKRSEDDEIERIHPLFVLFIKE